MLRPPWPMPTPSIWPCAESLNAGRGPPTPPSEPRPVEVTAGKYVKYIDLTYLCGIPSSNAQKWDLARIWPISESLVITKSPAWPAFRERMAKWVMESVVFERRKFSAISASSGIPMFRSDWEGSSQLMSSLVILSLAGDGAGRAIEAPAESAVAGRAPPSVPRYGPLERAWRTEYALIKSQTKRAGK